MPTDVRCQVETDGPALVRLTGVLDRTDVGTVRDTLLARLGDHTGPVVVDLSGLRITDPTVRTVFTEVRRTIADWPAADLLVCDPAGGWTVDGAPVWSSPALALAGLPSGGSLTVDLAPTVGAARQARELVTAGCARWDLADLVEAATIAVTEMVNNVVAHARTAMTVRLAPGHRVLRLGVRDHSPHTPRFTGQAPLTSTGGRGLLLIDTVARRWGCTPLRDGKLVWAVLHAEDEAGLPG
ncbi:Histidine kinase-like ATPase domain-containing protein [Micromonospora pallida]|uniref:Histidine kinase-like ATPase domain-containing protein n=1 Tax=Micromonospora pallida TaxID=145854 RepID=A0A1C6THG9_9ACTN|nr:ATP-binding protein [Micromonospora pallida]SCL41220.1 Histidine kinase-like ATPase domain-containing protein [Micromonospora pallida]